MGLRVECTATLAAVLSLPALAWTANAKDIVIEVEHPVGQVVVPVTPGEMIGGNRSSALQRKLHAAARQVCADAYRRDAYHYSRACTRASFRDALGQLRLLNGQRTVRQAAGAERLAILVRSR